MHTPHAQPGAPTESGRRSAPTGPRPIWAAGVALLEASDAGDVGGEEVNAVAVEVAAGAVVVLGGSRVGVPGENLRVAQRNAGVQGVGDGGVPQRVGADVPRDPGGLRDPGDHPVNVAAVDRLARDRSQYQWAAC